MSASPVEWGVGRSVVSDETAHDPAPELELVWKRGVCREEESESAGDHFVWLLSPAECRRDWPLWAGCGGPLEQACWHRYCSSQPPPALSNCWHQRTSAPFWRQKQQEKNRKGREEIMLQFYSI